MQAEETKVIDLPVSDLFTKFDRNNDGFLTRNELANILSSVFRNFGVNKSVNQLDVNNFLLDYDIKHNGNLTLRDFQDIKILRFFCKIRNVPVHQNYQPIHNSRVSGSQVVIPNNTVQHVQIPVSMLFDVFNRNRSGVLTRNQMKNVLSLVFRDFGFSYIPTDYDIDNFLRDFDIDHDNQITYADFRGTNVLNFDFHQNQGMRVYK